MEGAPPAGSLHLAPGQLADALALYYPVALCLEYGPCPASHHEINKCLGTAPPRQQVSQLWVRRPDRRWRVRAAVCRSRQTDYMPPRMSLDSSQSWMWPERGSYQARHMRLACHCVPSWNHAGWRHVACRTALRQRRWMSLPGVTGKLPAPPSCFLFSALLDRSPAPWGRLQAAVA